MTKNAKLSSKKSDKTSYPFADMESDFRNEALEQEEAATFTTPISIHIHSKRKRLVDADGVSAKGAIDGVVHSGVLPDDSPEFVQKVSYSQEKSKDEETIIELWEPINETDN